MFGNRFFGPRYYAPSYFGPEGVDIIGGAVKVKNKGLTEEQAEGLKALGRALRPEKIVDSKIIEPIDEISENLPIEIHILKEDYADLSQNEKPSEPVEDFTLEPTLQDKIQYEEDIGLILAIIEIHEN